MTGSPEFNLFARDSPVFPDPNMRRRVFALLRIQLYTLLVVSRIQRFTHGWSPARSMNVCWCSIPRA